MKQKAEKNHQLGSNCQQGTWFPYHQKKYMTVSVLKHDINTDAITLRSLESKEVVSESLKLSCSASAASSISCKKSNKLTSILRWYFMKSQREKREEDTFFKFRSARSFSCCADSNLFFSLICNIIKDFSY